MSDHLKKKSIGKYINLAAFLIAIVMAIVYNVYSNIYGLFDYSVLGCLVGVAALNIILFFFKTPIDELFKVISAFLSALATALFVVAFAGDISDYIQKVSFLGRGADIVHIIAITVSLLILVVMQIVSSGYDKKDN